MKTYRCKDMIMETDTQHGKDRIKETYRHDDAIRQRPTTA